MVCVVVEHVESSPELRVDGELLYLGGRGEVQAVPAVTEAERLRYSAKFH